MHSCDLAQHAAVNEFVGRNKVAIDPSTTITRSEGNPGINGKIHFWEGGGLDIDQASNLVIGAKTVVSGTIPPYAVVVGNPGRIVKFRFAADVIDLLLEIKWWDWPAHVVMQRRNILCSNDVARLRELCGLA